MATTAYKLPGTAVDDSSFGSDVWVNPGSALLADRGLAGGLDTLNKCASINSAVAINSHYLKCTNFGFAEADFPAGSQINGINVKVQRYMFLNTSNGQTVSDQVLKLVNGSGTVVGTNKASGSTWPTINNLSSAYAFAVADIGGILDADIKSSNFGVVLSVLSVGTLSHTAYVDDIQVQIDYTPALIGNSKFYSIPGDTFPLANVMQCALHLRELGRTVLKPAHRRNPIWQHFSSRFPPLRVA